MTVRFIKYSGAQINNGPDGYTRKDDVWIDTDEYIRDSGKRKGIKMMGMEVTEVRDKLYLHFKGDDAVCGIFLGWLIEDHVWDKLQE